MRLGVGYKGNDDSSWAPVERATRDAPVSGVSDTIAGRKSQ